MRPAQPARTRTWTTTSALPTTSHSAKGQRHPQRHRKEDRPLGRRPHETPRVGRPEVGSTKSSATSSTAESRSSRHHLGDLRGARAQFMNGVGVYTPRPSRRIDQSVLAHGIATDMRTLDPRQPRKPRQESPPPNPRPLRPRPRDLLRPKTRRQGTGLYEALAEDTSDNPTYTLDRTRPDPRERRRRPRPTVQLPTSLGGPETAPGPKGVHNSPHGGGSRLPNPFRQDRPHIRQRRSHRLRSPPGRSKWLDRQANYRPRVQAPRPETVDIFPDYEAFKVGLKAFATNSAPRPHCPTSTHSPARSQPLLDRSAITYSTLDIEQLQARRGAELARDNSQPTQR